MAKTYLDIQNSAYTVGNIMDWTNALTRLSGVPVDITEVYDSYDKAVEYAATNPVAYEGQVISVTENGKTTVYVITPTVFGTHTVGEGDDAVVYNNYLAEVGSKTEGDGNTIELDGQTLKLAGLKDIDTSKTYVPSLEGGKLVWRLPDNSTVNDLSASVASLDTRVGALGEAINGKAAEGEEGTEGYKPAVVGLTTKVDTNTEAIADIKEELGTAFVPAEGEAGQEGYVEAKPSTGIYKAIDDALQAAKDYADASDEDTAYDDTELKDKIGSIEADINDHETRIAGIELFFEDAAKDEGEGENLKNALDTLVEIQNYITTDGSAVKEMTTDINANKAAIEILNGDVNTAGSVDKKIATAIAPLATAADLNYVKATAEAAATQADIDRSIAGKANSADVYTKTEIDSKIGTPGKPAVTDSEGNEVTAAVQGTGVFANAYSRTEIDKLLDEVQGGSSASADSVLRQLNTYKSTNDERVQKVENKNAEQDAAITAADNKGQQGINDAAAAKAVADNAASAVTNLSNGQVNTNKNDIATINALVTGTGSENPETSHAARIGALEAYKTTHTGEFNSLKGRVDANEAEIAKKADLTGVYTKTQIDDFVNAKANSADVYTKGETDSAISGAVNAAVDGIDLKPYAKASDVAATVQSINAAIEERAKTSDVYTKTEADAAFMTQTEVDDRINALVAAADPAEGKVITNIQNLVKYVDENAGDIAGLITTVGDNTKAIQTNTENISTISAAITAIVAPKASKEISVDTDGTVGIIEMNVNKLVQTEGDILILNGGDAGLAKTEA